MTTRMRERKVAMMVESTAAPLAAEAATAVAATAMTKEMTPMYYLQV